MASGPAFPYLRITSTMKHKTHGFALPLFTALALSITFAASPSLAQSTNAPEIRTPKPAATPIKSATNTKMTISRVLFDGPFAVMVALGIEGCGMWG